MKRLRKRDRKFLVLMGATALLIAAFFFAGVQVGRMVTGGARKVDTGKIEAMIDEGELSSKPARYGRAVESEDSVGSENGTGSGDRDDKEDPDGREDGPGTSF